MRRLGWTCGVLLLAGCGSLPVGMIPGTYNGTIFCDLTVEDVVTGFLLIDESTTEHFSVGLNAFGEVLIDGAPVEVGDRLILPFPAGQFNFVVREVLALSTVLRSATT